MGSDHRAHSAEEPLTPPESRIRRLSVGPALELASTRVRDRVYSHLCPGDASRRRKDYVSDRVYGWELSEFRAHCVHQVDKIAGVAARGWVVGVIVFRGWRDDLYRVDECLGGLKPCAQWMGCWLLSECV